VKKVILSKNDVFLNCSIYSTSEKKNLEYNSFKNIVPNFGQNLQQLFMSFHTHQIQKDFNFLNLKLSSHNQVLSNIKNKIC
jgi:hypothetical protein